MRPDPVSTKCQVGHSIVGKPKRWLCHKITAGNRGTPIFFDILDDQISTLEVVDKGMHFGAIHGIGQISHEHNVLALVDHLSDAERPPQDTHVRVYSHHDHVLDLAFPHHVISFRTVGDDITRLDLEDIDLHRLFDGFPILSVGRPLARRITETPTVGIVDG